LDQGREQSFTVVQKEEYKSAEFGGIPLRYSIDRVDLLEGGQRVLIDYKTGSVNKNDWNTEQIRKPQLPLYALLYEQENSSTSGTVDAIAFAKLKLGDFKFVAHGDDSIKLSGIGRSNKLTQWPDIKDEWRTVLEGLADDFKTGVSPVAPIDEKTCEYCDLSAFCRINQFRQQGSQDWQDEEADYE
jgi:ATP-dependent helicase/DNAse subunit B